jgi:hypothetical protein
MSRVRFFCAAYAAAALAPGAAPAQSSLFTFTKVADSDTLLPGAAGMFRGPDEEPPALEAGRVAFWTFGDDADGVYLYTPGSGLALVVDTSAMMPHAPVPFEFHDYISLDDGRVVFIGYGSDENGENYYEGIYRFDSGGLSRIADLTTPIPGKPAGLLEFYGAPSSDNGQVAFIGVDYEELEDGVYVGNGGPVARVADTSTLVPGSTENFEYFYAVSADSGNVALIADSETASGIYLHDTATGAITRVADTTTQAPGRDENFDEFGEEGSLDLDGDAVGFISGDGVYMFDAASGVITRVADTTTPIPGATGLFRDAFTAVAVDGGHIALGYGLEGSRPRPPFPPIPQTPFFGVYTDLGGSLASVLRAGDILDGRVVERAFVGPEGLDGNQIAMSVLFADDTEGIYVATLIPEPATLALLLAGCLLAIALKRRRTFSTTG